MTVFANPMEPGGPTVLYPPDVDPVVGRRAAVNLACAAGADDRGALRDALMALGLINDPEHKPTKWTGNR